MTTRYAPLLTKIDLYPRLRWRDNGYGSVSDVLAPLVNVNLVQVTTGEYDTYTANLTPLGKIFIKDISLGHALASKKGEQMSNSERSDAALWMWLLTHGHKYDYYGAVSGYGPHGEVAHILTCGLDLNASESVKDDTWYEFADSFHDSNNIVGVSGNATCQCRKVEGYSMVGNVDSMTELLRQALRF